MLKKWAQVSHAPRSWRLIYPILDTCSEALSNERGYSRSRLAKANAMLAPQADSRADCKFSCSAWPEPSTEALLETDSERLLKISAAAQMASSSAFGK
jgi:hypothetical protein